MYLQFFAETNDDTKGNTDPEDKTGENKGEKTEKQTQSLEEAKAEIEKLKVDNAKMKKAMDKAMSEASESKKKLNNYLSDEEQKALKKQEEDAIMKEELESLRKDKKISDSKNSFLEVGYDKDTAEKLAIAQIEGDTETYFALLKNANDTIKKTIKEDFIKNRPEPAHGSNAGTGDDKEQDDFLKGFDEGAKKY